MEFLKEIPLTQFRKEENYSPPFLKEGWMDFNLPQLFGELKRHYIYKYVY